MIIDIFVTSINGHHFLLDSELFLNLYSPNMLGIMVNKEHLLEIHYRQKAESGDRFSMHKLGSVLEARGAVDSKTGAEYWYRRAIELGSEVGQQKLNALLEKNSVLLMDTTETSVDSEILTTNHPSPIKGDIKQQEVKSIDLNAVYGLDSFSFKNRDLIRATRGLALIIDNEYWIIQNCSYASVIASSRGVNRAYSLGDCFLTEGKRFGPLVPPRPGDPTDLSILLEDRICKICIDFVGDDQVLRDPISLDAIRKISLRMNNDFETIRNDLRHLETSAEIACAVMGIIEVGAVNCGYPTNSVQLSRFFRIKKLDWLGIDWPMSLISEWEKILLSSTQAREIVDMGVDVKIVQEWIDFRKSSLREQEITFDDIKSWIVVGLDPELCMEFSDFGLNPSNALLAVTHNVSPVKAGLWMEHGIYPSLVSDWESFSISPAVAWEWTKLGCAPNTAFEWTSHSYGPDIFLTWGGVTANVQLVQLCIDNQITPETLQNWLLMKSYVSSDKEIIVWIESGISPNEAKRWAQYGVPVEVAKSWHLGLGDTFQQSIDDLAQWARNSFFFESARRWIQYGIQIEDAIHARACGFTIDEYTSWSKWSFRPRQNFKQIVAWSKSDFTPIQVEHWLAAGVKSIEEAKQIRAAGFSGATVDIYRANNKPIKAKTVRKVDTIVRAATEEWLEEVIARAITSRPSHRKVAHWPSVLELDEDGISIEIVFLEGLIRGTVVRDGKSQYCAFDPANFEPQNHPETDQGRLVLGLCICWFIDCSIVIPALYKSSQGRPYSSVGANPNSISSRCRYVPTLTFKNRREISESNFDRLVVRHKVSGHLRTLGYGRKGSSEARGNAPTHLRQEMKSNETFVRSHFRGSEKERGELVTRLSRYSATADALAELG